MTAVPVLSALVRQPEIQQALLEQGVQFLPSPFQSSAREMGYQWLNKPRNQYSGKRRRDYRGWPRRHYYHGGQSARYRSFMPRHYRKRYNRKRRYGARRNYRRRRYNKYRNYSRRNWQKGNLKGLTGTQCMPSHAMCKFQRKVTGSTVIVGGSTAIWSASILLSSTNGSRTTFGIPTSGSTALCTTVANFTTPFVFAFLRNAFDECRIYAQKINIKFWLMPSDNALDAGGEHIRLRMNTFDFIGGSTDVPSTADTVSDAMLSKDCVIKNMHGNFDIGSGTNKYYAPKQVVRFKKFLSTPSIQMQPSTKKEYFNDSDFANLISGSLDSRVLATAVRTNHLHTTMSWSFVRDQAMTATKFIELGYMGTITQYTYWAKRNPALKYTD